jgi:methionyl-tRNA formyltransferase
MAPRPGALTELSGEPLRILAARSLPSTFDAAELAPGTIVRGGDPLVRIATGDGWLVPLRVQRAGARALDIEAFLRGRDLPAGARLGPENDA